MTHFILLRHGQTEWNLTRRYQGQTDIPLNDTGIKQAHEAYEKLKNVPFDLVFCSDLSRAKQTAQIVLEGRNCSINFDKILRERSYGDYEGGSFESSKMDPAVVDDIKKHPLTFAFPHGETVLDVAKRAKLFYYNIHSLYPDKSILVVSHGSFISVFYCMMAKIPLEMRHTYIPHNADPVFVDCNEDEIDIITNGCV